MRPIEKKQPGDSVQYTDSRGNIVNHVVQADYEDYADAKLPLVGNIDSYCSYCECLREIDALEIEHRPARHNGGSETEWDNFLLCCKVCNTVKSTHNGHWSIWFTAFVGVDAILSRLISDFTGTCSACFDANNHFMPLPRNPHNVSDPI